jgi:hypothetical protein
LQCPVSAAELSGIPAAERLSVPENRFPGRLGLVADGGAYRP